MSEEYDPEQDKEWRERHPTPSGLEDGHPDKKPQPVPAEHHEEGHLPA